MEEKAFCDAFPFHIVFDKQVSLCALTRNVFTTSFTNSLCVYISAQLKVRHTGVNIQKFVPGLQARDAKLDGYFTLVHPQV